MGFAFYFFPLASSIIIINDFCSRPHIPKAPPIVNYQTKQRGHHFFIILDLTAWGVGHSWNKWPPKVEPRGAYFGNMLLWGCYRMLNTDIILFNFFPSPWYLLGISEVSQEKKWKKRGETFWNALLFGQERFLLDTMPSETLKKIKSIGALHDNFMMLVSVKYWLPTKLRKLLLSNYSYLKYLYYMHKLLGLWDILSKFSLALCMCLHVNAWNDGFVHVHAF
jgi:hypothetical protein